MDLIAYVDLAATTDSFTAVPIHLKAASARTFSLHRKYERIADLVYAFVWNVASDAEVYALTYAEAVNLAEQLGWTATDPAGMLLDVVAVQATLEPYRATPERWRQAVLESREVCRNEG